MSDVPFIAIGEDELGDTIQKGDYVTNGEVEGFVQYAIDEYGNYTNLLCFIKGIPHDYLVGINGKLLKGVRVLKRNGQEH